MAGVNNYQSKRLRMYFFHVFLFSVTIFIYWATIIYPVIDCKGMLCKLGPFLSFSLFSGATFILWGFFLFLFTRGKYDGPVVLRKDTEILDEEIE